MTKDILTQRAPWKSVPPPMRLQLASLRQHVQLESVHVVMAVGQFHLFDELIGTHIPALTHGKKCD